MKNIDNYILEKLIIDKDVKKRSPDSISEKIIDMAGGDYVDTKLVKIIDDWINNDNDNKRKRIYFYYYELDHSRFKEYIKKYDNIVVQSVQDSVMKKTMSGKNFEPGETIYSNEDKIKSIKKVRNNDLLIYSEKCWYDYPIIVEKGL